jgi:hypothetical protein
MNTRCFLLPAIIVALFAVSWSPADDLPQAPPPRVKKTTAELLVGKWKVVSVEGTPIAEGHEYTSEFTADGKYIYRVEKSRDPVLPPPRMGTYRLNANMISLETGPTNETRAISWKVMIKSITEDKLILIARDQPSKYVRVKGE